MLNPNPIRTPLAILLLSLGSSGARAEENYATLTRDQRVVGDLEPGDRDVLVFEEARGARVRFSLRWKGGGEPTIELYSPRGPLDLTAWLKRTRRGIVVRPFELMQSGRHYLVVRASEAGTYDVSWKSLPLRRIDLAGSDEGAGDRLVLALPGEGVVTLRLDGDESSGYAPEVVEVLDPGGAAIPFDVQRHASATTQVQFASIETGSYEVRFADPAQRAGSWRARARVQVIRTSNGTLSLMEDPSALQSFPADRPEFEPYRRLHRIAAHDSTIRAYKESSFDRRGGNDDGLSGSFSAFYQDSQGEFVIFDKLGPGVVDRFHFSFRSTPGLLLPIFIPTAEDYDIRFYFDDESIPRISMPIRDFVSGTVHPFLSPLVGDDIVSPGGPYVYYPVAFEKRLKITTTRIGFYYHVSYHLIEPGARQTLSFDPVTADPTVLNALLDRTGDDPHGGVELSIGESKDLIVSPGSRGEAFRLDAPGWITCLEFRPSPSTVEWLSRVQLRVFFDRETSPSVDCPLDLFFGSGIGEADVKSLFFEMTPGGAYRSWWPMPFGNSARVELVNQSAVPIALSTTVHYLPVPYGGDFGVFRARAREAFAPPFSQWGSLRDFVIFDEAGHGDLVGLSLTVGSPGVFGLHQPRSYLEGDVHAFVDGMQTPSIHGTGTEETFNWGWYDAVFALPFSLPLHGFSKRLEQGIADYTASYRVMLADRIPFENRLLYSIEQGPTGFEGAHYLGVGFAYVRPAPRAVLTDELDVGSVASELTHLYQSSASQFRPSMTSEFEVGANEPDFTSEGRAETGSHSFRMQIDPSNRGVILRRLADQGPDQQLFVHQRARIYVDGFYAGDWYSVRTNIWRRWLEEEFVLPASLTADKSSIVVTVEPLTTEWNAYRYRVLSRSL